MESRIKVEIRYVSKSRILFAGRGIRTPIPSQTNELKCYAFYGFSQELSITNIGQEAGASKTNYLEISAVEIPLAYLTEMLKENKSSEI